MIAFAPGIEKVKSALLAFGQEAVVVHAGEESEARGGGGLLRDEARRQLMETIHRNQVAGFDAVRHLLEEGDGALARIPA